jgi:hypothetical protein
MTNTTHSRSALILFFDLCLGSQQVSFFHIKKTNSVTLVCEQTIPTERPPLMVKLVPTLADGRYRVVSAADPYGRILGFLDQSR